MSRAWTEQALQQYAALCRAAARYEPSNVDPDALLVLERLAAEQRQLARLASMVAVAGAELGWLVSEDVARNLLASHPMCGDTPRSRDNVAADARRMIARRRCLDEPVGHRAYAWEDQTVTRIADAMADAWEDAT